MSMNIQTCADAERNIVAIPTIKIARFPNSEQRQLFVQWYGQNRMGSIENRQFCFSIPIAPEHPQFCGEPDLFYVVMLGTAGDWPIQENRDEIIRLAKTEDADILWLMLPLSSYRSIARAHGIDAPVDGDRSFVIPMTTRYGDGRYGIVRPQKYFDPGPLECDKAQQPNDLHVQSC